MGPVTLSASAGKVVFATDIAIWTVDILHFSGNPKLQVSSQEGVITVSLRQARFPGTGIPADFTAVCFKDDDQQRWLMDLSFAWGGFTARVDLENWLNGVDLAQSTLLGIE